MKRVFFTLFYCLLLAVITQAQEFEIKRYDLNARVDVASQSVEIEARLQLVNLSARDLLDKLLLAGEDKPRLTFFLNPKAKVSTLAINGAAVNIKTAEDTRNNLLRISTDITSTIASAREFETTFNYTISATERSPYLRVSYGDTFLLPPSFWVPAIHTPFGDHGADTAPFSLVVKAPAGKKIISSGIRKTDSAFEQSLAALPFFIVGDFDVTARGGNALPIEIYTQPGLNDLGKQQTQRLAAEAERVLSFYVKYFNQAASAPLRIISISNFGSTAVAMEAPSPMRESTHITTGALLLNDNFFRRNTLDLGTIELLAGTAARTWIDGRVLLRGRGSGMLRDALPTYLVAQYLGERSGATQREAAFERKHRAYAPLARGSDVALLVTTPLDRNYTTSMHNKGALVWRILERQIGRQHFDQTIRGMLNRQRIDVLSLIEWRSPLCEVSRCANVKSLLTGNTNNRQAVSDIFAQWVEKIILPDFAIGQPQKTATGQESTIVNFGNGDFTIDVIATTTNGEELRQSVSVKGSEYGTVTFPANAQIVSVEADPEKIYPQKDYANDTYPRRQSPSDLFGQANLAFSKNDYAAAEIKTREAIASDTDSPTLQAFLGRILLAQNKNDEVAKIFESVLKNELITIQAYAWAHFGLGQLALQQKKPADAASHYRLASAVDLDPATTIAVRNGALAAEQEANALRIPEDVRAFLKEMDTAILQGSSDAINPLIDLGNLRRFAQSLVIRKPSVWATEALRIEEWDTNRIAIDISLKIKIDNRDHIGRALYVLRRNAGKLLLGEVPVFDVK